MGEGFSPAVCGWAAVPGAPPLNLGPKSLSLSFLPASQAPWGQARPQIWHSVFPEQARSPGSGPLLHLLPAQASATRGQARRSPLNPPGCVWPKGRTGHHCVVAPLTGRGWVPTLHQAQHCFRPPLLNGYQAWGPGWGRWGRVNHSGGVGHPPSVPSPRSCSHWLAQVAVSSSLTARTAWDDLVKLSSLGGPGPGPHPSSRASLSARSSCGKSMTIKALLATAPLAGMRQPCREDGAALEASLSASC